MSTLRLSDVTATEALGAHLAAAVLQSACPDVVVLLEGPLGSGKTTLARGFLRALGETGPVGSPTYAIVNSYPALAASHADVYRLRDVGELEQVGLLDAVERGIWLVEWGSRFPDAWPEDRVEVHLTCDDGRGARLLATGPRSRALVRAVVA